MGLVRKFEKQLAAAKKAEKDAVCQSCGGKGWLLDSTYDRCGANVSCGRCFGTGFGAPAVSKIIDKAFSKLRKPIPKPN